METLLNLNLEEFKKKFRELSWEEKQKVNEEIEKLIALSKSLLKKVLRWLLFASIGLAGCVYGYYNDVPYTIPASIVGAILALCFGVWAIVLIHEHFKLNDKKDYIEFFRFGKRN